MRKQTKNPIYNAQFQWDVRPREVNLEETRCVVTCLFLCTYPTSVQWAMPSAPCLPVAIEGLRGTQPESPGASRLFSKGKRAHFPAIEGLRAARAGRSLTHAALRALRQLRTTPSCPLAQQC